jgi:uncharacterized Rmd1/YagE family protein
MQHTNLFSHSKILVRATFLGSRISIKTLDQTNLMAVAPLTLAIGEQGCVVLFRYGAAIFFNVDQEQFEDYLAAIKPYLSEVQADLEAEEAELIISQDGKEGIHNDAILLNSLSIEKLQLVAIVLAKSIALAHYENQVIQVFDEIEPLAFNLSKKGKGRRHSKGLLRHIGNSLLIQHKTIGRIETLEKPELLWEYPEYERLYLRLTDEYQLDERQAALGAKLDLISKTAETLLDLLQDQRTLRVEWYITILIVIEIFLTLYELFFHGG